MSTDRSIPAEPSQHQPGLQFGAVADDLTGAIELAGMLGAGGCRAVVWTDTDSGRVLPQDVKAVVLAIQSRVAPPAIAARRFEAAIALLQALGARQIFFKYCATFDSIPSGNIGNCADILAEKTGAKSLLFCPSFPAVDRTVYRGHLFVGSQLVSESPKRLDPLTPMTEPDLVKVLSQQTRHPVGLVPLPSVRGGPTALRAFISEQAAAGLPFLIADSIEEEDLRLVAEATWDTPAMTGNSSVAAHYPAIWKRHGVILSGGGRSLPLRKGKGIVLAGSLAERTLTQIAEFERCGPVLAIDLLNPAHNVAWAIDWAVERSSQGPVCITTSTDHERAVEIQAELGVDGAARRAENLLGEIAVNLADRGFDRFLVAGGETSGAVIRALGVEQLEVAPFSAPGIGLCFAETPVSVTLCLKSGKLGDDAMFARVLDEMEGADALR